MRLLSQFLATLALALPALQAAPSITATGDLNTFLSPNPTSGPWNPGGLTVGNTSPGALTIAGGASVTSTRSVLGNRVGGDGTISVTGAGSSWIVNWGLSTLIGDAGTGTLTVADGASVSDLNGGSGNSVVTLGNKTGSSGTALVTGTNSTWTLNKHLEVGKDGTGTLTVADGGKLNVLNYNEVGIGLPTGHGTVRVTGAGSEMTGDTLVLNRGTLSIEDGGRTTSRAQTQMSANTLATVTGIGSVFEVKHYLIIDQAELRVEAGAQLFTCVDVSQTAYDYVALRSPNSSQEGRLTVTGAGSAWINSLDTRIGDTSSIINSQYGRLVIEAGASASDRNGYLGSGPYGTPTGAALVTGAGSTWTHSANLLVGPDGVGDLTIANGGRVSNVNGSLGANAGIGTVLVTGTDSTWENTGTLHVGQGGTGTLTVADGGAVTVTGTLTVHGADDSLILKGGTVTADGGVFLLADATLGGTGTIDGNLSLASGAKLVFGLNTTLAVTGTVSLDTSFGIASLLGLDATTAEGAYTLLTSTQTDFSTLGLQNWGYENRFRLSAEGAPYKAAYFSQGSLVVNVVPEPGTGMLLLLGLGAALFVGARRGRRNERNGT